MNGYAAFSAGTVQGLYRTLQRLYRMNSILKLQSQPTITIAQCIMIGYTAFGARIL